MKTNEPLKKSSKHKALRLMLKGRVDAYLEMLLRNSAHPALRRG